VPRFNLIDELNKLIEHEMDLAKAGKEGRIILKMNALQDPAMIERLYEASQAGVQIDLIVRGICCLKPNQPYSKNIRITRIVDSFLEHSRVWYFGNNGRPKLFLGSPDFMRRNLYRRIEAVTPVLDKDIKAQLIKMLHIQLADKRKASFVDEHLQHQWKSPNPQQETIRSQYTFYDYLKDLNK
jgi:polyphosphate kinase